MNTEMNHHKSRVSQLLRMLFLLAVVGSVGALLGAGLIVAYFSRDLPNIITVADYHPAGVTRVLGMPNVAGEQTKEDDLELGEFYKERRYLIPFEKIPPIVSQAFMAAEDDRFYEHPGINVVSIIRAGIANFRAGHVVQGGSTITQQVAKSLLLTSERSFDRKIKEVILSSRIERNLNKNQILYLYLNQIYLGHGAYGVQAASRVYFGKDISKITLPEAALLAGLPQAPSKYSPLLNPKRAKERQVYVLRRMMENRFISQQQLSRAVSEPVRIYKDVDLNTQYAPYFVEHVRRYLIEKYGEKKIYEEGLTVRVPISRALALAANRSLRAGLLSLDKRVGYRGVLKHLNSQDEITRFLADTQQQMIDAKVHGRYLLSDGQMDSQKDFKDALTRAGLTSESDLMEPGEFYSAVITGFDHARKSAWVSVGPVKAELNIDQMRWARSVAPGADPSARVAGPTPTDPSKVFLKGDVILVRKLPAILSKGAKVQVALEQDPLVQGALFSMDVKTGNVLSMIGGYRFGSSEFNRAIQAMRQPGSAFKPVIYASALEKGFTPATVIVDSPVVFKDSDGSWKPSNYEEKFYGDTTFRPALIKSRNIPTVKIVQSVQVPYLIEFAKRLGMNAQFNSDLSIALGSSTVSPLELTRVYAVFPRLGRKVEPIFITRVEDRDGKILEEPTTQTKANLIPPLRPIDPAVPLIYPLPDDPVQVLDSRMASVMTHLMKEVVTSGTGQGAQSLGRPAAGKTGTTNESVDAWFMGFTPQVVTGVWVGYDNQKSLGPGETGARAALPIWLEYMKEAVKPYPVEDFAVPPGVVFANINPGTGKLAPAETPGSILEAFVEGTQPTETSGPNGSVNKEQGYFFKEDRE